MKQQIIIDTDCGMDDIVAISMLASSPQIAIKGITTARGLTSPETGKNNLDKIFNFLGKDITIIPGSKYPLQKARQKNVFPKRDIINSSKLEFLTSLIGNTKTIEKTLDNFDKFIYQTVGKNPKKVTILCLGPLTNVALVINKYGAKFIKTIDKLVIMGGAVFSPGNVSPLQKAEYNIFLDPEAAEMVFSSGIPINLVSIDATKLVPVTKKFRQQVVQINPKRKYGVLIKKIISANKNDFKFFYDPLAAAILINPKIVLRAKKVGIKVVKKGPNTGQTLPTLNQKLIRVITRIDKEKFFNLLQKMLS